MDPASVTPSRHACLVNLLSSPVHTTASRHMQAVQYIYSPGPHTLSLLDCSLLWWDFPAFSCMSPCYQSCLFLVLLLCLPLVKDLSFLFLTKVSALTLLIPFCPLRLHHRVFCPGSPAFHLPWPSSLPVFFELVVCRESSKLLYYLHTCWLFCAASGFTHHPLQ